MCNYLKIRRKGTKKSAIPQIYFAKNTLTTKFISPKYPLTPKSGIDYISNRKLYRSGLTTAHFLKLRLWRLIVKLLIFFPDTPYIVNIINIFLCIIVLRTRFKILCPYSIIKRRTFCTTIIPRFLKASNGFFP